MASIHDLSAYILQRTGSIPDLQLHNLLYYAQAWHLVDEEEPLFPDRIEAWPPQPILPELFALTEHVWRLDAWPRGDAGALTDVERESVDGVLDSYGRLSDEQLIALVRREPPYRQARAGLGPVELSSNPITPAALYKYYSSLATNAAAVPIAELRWGGEGTLTVRA
ncbi:Panacea domain-containing protein [Actinoplanes sp. RD1]|uniref:Panacea domain-containing protein n=1 Tax=Actinoplanes sp. RD1 TaxID=3064538 RepID=UPI0027418477|nr:type II toxin-antitoxin system antitoxin SocA domain-containing protein [Actinoplanes sp. RD1]